MYIHCRIASSYIICALPKTFTIILWIENLKSVFSNFKVHSTVIKTEIIKLYERSLRVIPAT